MAAQIRRVEYFHATVRDEPGAAYQLLSVLAGGGVNLLVFSAVPVGPQYTQLVLFPEDSAILQDIGHRSGLALTGPDRALLIQGDDELGALARVHRQLADAGVAVYASNGITDGRGGFGYVVYVRPQDYERACAALGI